jgi:hypothetical protein
MTSSKEPGLDPILYPKGTKFDERSQLPILLEEYKLFVETSERLVTRRQTVNTFFLSVNVLLLSAVGLVVKEFIMMPIALTAVIAIGIAGILLCIAWRRLVHSYRQLNTGKFVLIQSLEKHLPAALFEAEWKALGEGKDKRKYTPFTKTEAAIPLVFMVIYGIAALGSLVYFLT